MSEELEKRMQALQDAVDKIVGNQEHFTKVLGDFQRDLEGVFSGPETNEPEPQSTPAPRKRGTTAARRTSSLPASNRGRGHAEQSEPEGEPDPEGESEPEGDTITPPPPHWYFRRAFGRE